MKKFKQFIKDANDLNNLEKCPNDFPLWYFFLLHLYLMTPIYLAFLLGYYLGG